MREEVTGLRVARLVRRRNPRFLLNLPLEYSPVDSEISHPGHAEDASEEGLKVYLPEQFQVGQTLRMKLFFSFGPGLSTIESTTQVVWADISPEGGNRYGVKFVEISPENQERWKKFMNSLALPKSS